MAGTGFVSKPLKSLVDLANLYAELTDDQRSRLLADISGALKAYAEAAWWKRALMSATFNGMMWRDDDKGEINVTVSVTGKDDPLFSATHKMKP